MPSTSAKHPKVLTVNCRDCGKERHFDKYAIARKLHERPLCQQCATKAYNATRVKNTPEVKKEYLKKHYQNNRIKRDAYTMDWRAKKRSEIINALGGKCVCCGETDQIVLDIDHINDNGAEHRRTNKRCNIITILRRERGHEGLQLLCKNCNWRKEHVRRQNAKRIEKTA